MLDLILIIFTITFLFFNGKNMFNDLKEVYKNTNQPKKKYIETFKAFYQTIFTCKKCFVFWLTLILSQSFVLASLFSFTTELAISVYLYFIKQK